MGSFFSKAGLVSDPAQFATLVDPSSEGRTYRAYDYVIVGAGAAGPVLAHRLSADPNTTVLLIEAGSSNDTLFAKIPIGAGRLWKSEYDWQYWTTPQSELNNRKLFQPRGKLLGGSTSINAMIYQHAANSDLEEWERLGAKGWGAEDMAKYFRMSEKNIPHIEFPINHEHRGKDGLWHTSYTYTTELSKKFLKACVAFGIPHIPDINTPLGSTGVTRALTFISENGARSSAATAYLDPITLERPNLTVAIHTQVTKILFSSSSSAKPRAIGVEMAKSSASPLYRVTAKKEVILSAGAFGTPQILNLSGIGSRVDLEKFGISIIKDLPAVGEHLSDHLTTGTIIYHAKQGTTLDYLAKALPGLPALIQWLVWGTGPLTTNAAEVAAFFRAEDYPQVAKPSSKPALLQECSSGPTTANTELIICPVYVNNHTIDEGKPDHDCMSIMCVALRPLSTGTVKIVSKSAFDYPDIDPKYLTNDNDLKVMIRAVRVAMKISRQEMFKESVTFEPTKYPKGHQMWLGNQDPDELTDSDIESVIRARAETLYHPVGTARMGHNEEDSVLDNQLKVRGIEGLRVCDASAFPAQISGHPTATIVAMAEKLSFDISCDKKEAVVVDA